MNKLDISLKLILIPLMGYNTHTYNTLSTFIFQSPQTNKTKHLFMRFLFIYSINFITILGLKSVSTQNKVKT